MIQFRGALSEDDFREATRLRRRVTKEGGSAADATLWLGVGFVILAWVYSYGPEGNLAALWWLPFALLCFAIWWRRRAKAEAVWRANRDLQTELHGTLSDESLEARLGGVDARIPWSLFSAHVASLRALVLFAGQVHLMLSRAMFGSDEEWKRALALVGGRVALPKNPTSLARILLWLGVLLVVFLLWHFARIQKVGP